MVDGSTASLSPGWERATILQRDEEGLNRVGMLRKKEMLEDWKYEDLKKLTFYVDNCKQESENEEMACLGRGRGRGCRGHWSQLVRKEPTTSEIAKLRRGGKSIKVAVNEAVRAYKEGTNADICQLI